MSESEIFGTEEYENPAIKAGEITPEGVNIIMESYEESEGKFGQFLKVKGKFIPDNGEEMVLLTSSTKLKKLIMHRWDHLKGCPVNLSGSGEKFERQYKVRLL